MRFGRRGGRRLQKVLYQYSGPNVQCGIATEVAPQGLFIRGCRMWLRDARTKRIGWSSRGAKPPTSVALATNSPRARLCCEGRRTTNGLRITVYLGPAEENARRLGTMGLAIPRKDFNTRGRRRGVRSTILWLASAARTQQRAVARRSAGDCPDCTVCTLVDAIFPLSAGTQRPAWGQRGRGLPARPDSLRRAQSICHERPPTRQIGTLSCLDCLDLVPRRRGEGFDQFWPGVLDHWPSSSTRIVGSAGALQRPSMAARDGFWKARPCLESGYRIAKAANLK